MLAPRVEARVTPAASLQRECQAETKSEYLDGYIVAMSGAGRLHTYVTGDIVGEPREQLWNSPRDIAAAS